MDIRLVVTDTKRKSLVFFSNTFKMVTLDEIIHRAKDRKIEGVNVVKGKYGKYVRSVPNAHLEGNIDSKSVTALDVISFANSTRHFKSTDAISLYTAHYYASVKESGKPFITTPDGYKAFIDQVRDVIKPHRELFKNVGKTFGVDSYLLAAIVIDETVRLMPFEGFQDKLLLDVIGRNVSVGLAQIRLETANGLIRNEYYNPNPNDTKLPFDGQMSNADREHLFTYVVEPRHNIRFEAAAIKNLIDYWKNYSDISNRPEIIGTVYSRGHTKRHADPKPSERGEQIAKEFYDYARKWLR